MTMARNNRNYQFDPNGGNGRSSFQEHDEHMRGFRRYHAGVAMVNAPRWDKATLIESMEPLPVSRLVTETGGSRFINGTVDWSALVPVLKVAQYKISHN